MPLNSSSKNRLLFIKDLHWDTWNMNKKEWQNYHQITDENMAIIEMAIKLFGGKVVRIWDKRQEGRWGDSKINIIPPPRII